jgi:hypothetical protein
MDVETFWSVVSETHDFSLVAQQKKLFSRLMDFSEDDVIDFMRMEQQFCVNLDTDELWGVCCMESGFESHDGFLDFRYWLLHCGQDVYERALQTPDDLVPVIESHPDAACEGIQYVALRVLCQKNAQWERRHPQFDLTPPKPSAELSWEEIVALLPKTHDRYIVNPPPEDLWHNMTWEEKVASVGGDRRDEAKKFAFGVEVEESEINGHKATEIRFTEIREPEDDESEARDGKRK